MNGNDLIKLGYKTGPHFIEMLSIGNSLEEHEIPADQIKEALDEIYEEAIFEEATIPLQDAPAIKVFLEDSDVDYIRKNNAAVIQTMTEVMKTPTIIGGSVMPDACPAGPLGTIPVGGVAVAKNAIHPGMHSADICCSMFLTSYKSDNNVSEVLDAIQEASHFGPGGHGQGSGREMKEIFGEMSEGNKFLDNVPMQHAMMEQFKTQGDGNHFFFVGRKESNMDLTFVTHHGSRKPGAMLYKAGMKLAETYRQKLSPATLKQNAWIPYDTDDGEQYWAALQVIREWTKMNHTAIHTAVEKALGIDSKEITDRFWNEHNFVFKRSGNEFHHAKGSTPVWGFHAEDADQLGRTIIPLNMGAPILLVKKHKNNETGFAPHGAGRYMSRTQYNKNNKDKTIEQMMEEQAGHIDARFYSGKPDSSELPNAYKNADEITAEIKRFQLANIVDKIQPLGSMMAGEFPKPWLNKRIK